MCVCNLRVPCVARVCVGNDHASGFMCNVCLWRLWAGEIERWISLRQFPIGPIEFFKPTARPTTRQFPFEIKIQCLVCIKHVLILVVVILVKQLQTFF